MKKNLFLPMLAGGFLMTSCSQEAFVAPESEQYAQEFSKVFGSIDPNHDWSMASANSITVNATPGAQVSVYAFNGRVHKLVASYSDFSGSEKISFDALKGFDSFIVSDGVHTAATVNGGSVSLPAMSPTRAIASDLNNSGTIKTEDTQNTMVTENSEYTEFNVSDIQAFINFVPEDGNNRGNENLSTNFSMSRKLNKVTVYPVYYYSGYWHEVGIYTYDDNGNIVRHKPFFDNRYDAEKLQYKSGDSWRKAAKNYDSRNQNNTIYYSYDIDNVSMIRSKGFVIEVPENQEFGFYINSYNDNKTTVNGQYFTEKRHNNQTITIDGTKTDCEGTNMASYAEINGKTFVAFDDNPKAMNPKYDSADLNDMVLLLDPEPYVIDKDAEQFIIAAEDLGGTYDYDFNDIVFSVKYIAGEETAEITPLAAGGTLPAFLYYKDELVGGKEFHQLFEGGKTGSMINTDKEGKVLTSQPITINVGKEFRLSRLSEYGDNVDSLEDFKIKVNGERELTAPGFGEAPQIMVLSPSWLWPTEGTRIDNAYPNFGEWGQNYGNSNWGATRVEENVIQRQ